MSIEDEYYLKQLKEEARIDIEDLSTEEKMKELRKLREARYEKLKRAVYKRRGWTENGVPTLEKLKELGMDFPELFDLVKKHQ